VCLTAGETGGYLVEDEEEARWLMDAALGIYPDSRVSVRWEAASGVLTGDLASGRRLRLLQKVCCITRSGELLANLNTADNILLPVNYASPRRREKQQAELLDLVGEKGRFGHDITSLTQLPHALNDLQRVGAALLRTWLLAPELMVFCHPHRELSAAEGVRLGEWLGELRKALPESIWFVLTPDCGLFPEGFGDMAGPVL